MEEEWIEPKERMFDLVAEERELFVELGVECREDLRGEVRDTGITQDQMRIIPIDKFPSERNGPRRKRQCDECREKDPCTESAI